ncbi:MAG: radical SAM protein [Candidatus Omnitrophota bacterium]|jgi:DNA repair photolyase
MVKIAEVTSTRILNPTSIGLGEYVINPYVGCEFGCLYCYVRSNHSAVKRKDPWGGYVDIRINAPELLEKELAAKKPSVVLLGSTTECFQPQEEKSAVTGRLLEILNRSQVQYVILTRSPYIQQYLSLLRGGFCKKVYFTVNSFKPELKASLEPKSPDFNARICAINTLLGEGIPVVPYFSPLLPWISDFKSVFTQCEKANHIEFECLNFSLSNCNDIIEKISSHAPAFAARYARMQNDQLFYNEVWENIKKEIMGYASEAKKKVTVYTHDFGDYFKNKYS